MAVELRKIICSTNTVGVTKRPLPTRRAATRHPLAGPTGRGQPRWLARCVYDHRDHARKTVPRTSRKEVHRHQAYGHTTNHQTG